MREERKTLYCFSFSQTPPHFFGLLSVRGFLAIFSSVFVYQKANFLQFSGFGGSFDFLWLAWYSLTCTSYLIFPIKTYEIFIILGYVSFFFCFFCFSIVFAIFWMRSDQISVVVILFFFNFPLLSNFLIAPRSSHALILFHNFLNYSNPRLWYENLWYYSSPSSFSFCRLCFFMLWSWVSQIDFETPAESFAPFRSGWRSPANI